MVCQARAGGDFQDRAQIDVPEHVVIDQNSAERRLAGDDFAAYADLPKASSLCGACNEVCPVDIPIPDLLLRLRDKAFTSGASNAKSGTPPMGPYAWLATHPAAWRAAMRASPLANLLPLKLAPVPPLQHWLGARDLPAFRGGEFRDWMRDRKEGAP